MCWVVFLFNVFSKILTHYLKIILLIIIIMLLIFILSYVGLTLFTSKLHFHYPTMTETIAEFSFENIQ